MAQDQELQDTANSLQIEIADYTKRIQKLADLDANDLPEIREKIKAAGQLRSEAKKKLENLFSSAGRVEVAEYAWAEILGELTGIPGVISNGSIDRNALRTALSKLNAAGFELENQLKNQNTRRQLAAHMPSLIGGIILDGLNLRYAVKSLNGKVGEWRNLEPIMTALLLPGLEVKRNTMRANSQRYWDSLNSEQREDRMKHVRVGFRKMVKGLSPQKRKQLMSAARQASKAKRDAAKLSSSSQQGA